jgi:mannose-6-phosphate isomerase-like protein (cupin superfamily)
LKASRVVCRQLCLRQNPTGFSLITLASLALVLLDGCTTPRNMHYWFSNETIRQERIEDVLRRDALAPNQNIRVSDLGTSPNVSHHLVQVRFGETLHVHKDHDLTVVVYRGEGELRLGAGTIPLRQGDVVFIPRGVSHAFQNTANTPTAAVVVFTPAFDGKDTIPVTKEGSNTQK